MAIQIDERFLSRSQSEGESRSAELVFLARATAGENELEVKWAVINYAPLVYDGMVAQGANLDQINATMYEVAVQYGERKRLEIGDVEITFDTTGATQHVTQSKATVGNYASPGVTPPDFRGAIGVTKKTVEGVDIPARAWKWNERHVVPELAVNDGYRHVLGLLTGTVNNVPFRGKAPGEVLFLGSTDSPRDQDKREVLFQFAFSPNAYNLQIGDIVVPFKRGWDYLWVRYADDEDGDAKMPVKRPLSVHIEQVHDYTNFAQLGIGL
ncbi:MAG: hypothetical protein JW818_09825 [Pirellulales bacterium]|nr:hypothetical protein [Pirellulales bacterium]